MEADLEDIDEREACLLSVDCLRVDSDGDVGDCFLDFPFPLDLRCTDSSTSCTDESDVFVLRDVGMKVEYRKGIGSNDAMQDN